jgi:dihydroorotase
VSEGLLPHSLSTDRVGSWPYASKNYNMLEIMTQWLAFGMSLEEVVRRSTASPAEVIGHPELGTLKTGSVGDAAVLEFEEGEFAYEDQLGHEVRTERRLAAVLTVKDGKRWRPWRDLP